MFNRHLTGIYRLETLSAMVTPLMKGPEIILIQYIPYTHNICEEHRQKGSAWELTHFACYGQVAFLIHGLETNFAFKPTKIV